MSAHNSLLGWASERGSGSWVHWINACRHLELTTGKRLDATGAARRLSALGHIEFDWRRNRFAAAPPAAVLIPRSSGCVIITGARHRGMRDELDALIANSDLNVWLRDPIPQPEGPDTWLLEAELDEVQAFCTEARLEFEFDSGRRIAQDLCPQASLDTAAEPWPEGPDDRYPRSWLDPDQLRFQQNAKLPDDSGLWHVSERRRDEAYIRMHGSWHHVPVREYGPFLAYPQSSFLRYREKAYELDVPNLTPLPPLLARAATLQSGRLPLRYGTSHRYLNVDLELAGSIAGRLRTQTLRMR